MATSNIRNIVTSAALEAFEDQIAAQIQEGKARLEQLEAKAKGKGAEAETAAINTLKAAKQNISRKVQELKRTHESDMATAKADIEADVADLKSAIDALGAKLKNYPTRQ
jgi:uncharacterized protein YukE